MILYSHVTESQVIAHGKRALRKGGLLFANRESTADGQSPEANCRKLAEWATSIGVPFLDFYLWSVTACGILGNNAEWIDGLVSAIEFRLNDCKRLTVFLLSIDRLFRPFGFKTDDEGTWEPSDCIRILTQLSERLGARAKDVDFVVLDNGAIENRVMQISIGKEYKMTENKRNSERKSQSVPQKRIDRKTGKRLQEKTVKLAARGLSVPAIFERFRSTGVSLRSIRRWVAKAGYAAPAHRPKVVKSL